MATAGGKPPEGMAKKNDMEPLLRTRQGNVMIRFEFLKEPFDAMVETGWEEGAGGRENSLADCGSKS